MAPITNSSTTKTTTTTTRSIPVTIANTTNKVSTPFSNPTKPLTNTTKSIFFPITNSVNKLITPSQEERPAVFDSLVNFGMQIGAAFIFIVLLVIIVGLIKSSFINNEKKKLMTVTLIDGTVNSRKKFIQISSDPESMNFIPIARSNNAERGIEFTYMFWIFIDDFNYKLGLWKHVMHKGNSTSWPDRCPGVWIAPDKNDMYIYYNTFAKIDNHVIVEEIPLNKWMHVALIAHDINFDVYINGNLKSRDVLDSPIKQNYGDIFFNQYNGFSGYLSNVYYSSYAISYSELSNHINKGVSQKACIDTGDAPPYFDQRWYLL